MNIYINDILQSIKFPEITIKELFDDIQLESSKGIAVAVNGEVVPKTSWHSFQVQENDKLIIIKATQGG